MTAPLLVAQIQGQGTVSADNLNTYIQNCTNIEQLRLFIGLPGMCVFIDGTVTPGDGGAGPFYWNTTAIGPDNNSTVIVPQPGVAGAWVRLVIAQTSPINVTNIASLRNFDGGAASPVVWIEGYYTLADGGEGMFVYNPNDITSTDNGGTIIIDAANHRYYREYGKMPFNICWFGADVTGVLDSSTALNSALAALPSGGGQIFFPPGQFKFNSAITYTIPSGFFSVSFVGSGADVSTLYWPGSNAITINASNQSHSVHFRDLTFSTGSTNGYSCVTINQSVALGLFEQSDFTRVNFRGQNITFFWNPSITINGLSNVDYNTCFFLSTGNNSLGVSLNGSSSSPFFSIVHNFTGCGFFGCSDGIFYGNNVQGVTISQTNFTNGNVAITVTCASGAAQLAISDSQFNTAQNQIVITSPITGLFVHNNLIYVSNNNSGIYFLPSSSGNQATISGNTFSGATLTNNGISFNGSAGSFSSALITGNVFNHLGNAVDLAGAVSSNVQANLYPSCTNTVVNIGSNSVGVATQ